MTAARRPHRPDRDWTDAESEGIPATDEQPPGIDPETAAEGEPLPGDRPRSTTDHGVTAAEGRAPETLEERVARETPDVPAEDDDVERPVELGRLSEPEEGADDGEVPRFERASDGQLTGDWSDDRGGLTAEEAAVHVVDEGVTDGGAGDPLVSDQSETSSSGD